MGCQQSDASDLVFDKDWRGPRVGLLHRWCRIWLIDCGVLSPGHEAGHPQGGTSGEEAPQCGCWGDFWGRVLAKRTQAWKEEGKTAARLATCLRPYAGHPLFGRGLVSSCVNATTFQKLLCQHCSTRFTRTNSFFKEYLKQLFHRVI